MEKGSSLLVDPTGMGVMLDLFWFIYRIDKKFVEEAVKEFPHFHDEKDV